MPMNAHNHASAKTGQKAQARHASFSLRGHVVTGAAIALLLVLGFGGWPCSPG